MEGHNNQLLTESIFLIKDEATLRDKLLFERLCSQVNELIIHDFERLVSLLYRIDVSEKKLTVLLENNKTTDSARVIAQLIIERQAQKIRSRQENRQDPNHIADEEKW